MRQKLKILPSKVAGSTSRKEMVSASTLPYLIMDLPKAYNRIQGKTAEMMRTRRKIRKILHGTGTDRRGAFGQYEGGLIYEQ